MGNNKKRFVIALCSFTVVIAALAGLVLRRLGIHADSAPYVTFTVDKATANPGDDLTYTLLVRNTLTIDLSNVVGATTLDSNVTYVSGSGTYTKAGTVLQIPDAWTQDRLNMGTMVLGQENTIVYKVHVPNTVASGTVIHEVGQIEPEGLSAQAYSADTSIITPDQTTNLLGGDVFQAANNTTQVGWGDPIAAVMGNVIEYKMRITNYGAFDAHNAMIHIQIPWDPKQPSLNLVSTATVTADNAATLSDTATVTLTGQPSYLWPKDGHYHIVGVTDLYNCPNGCDLPKNFLWNPMLLGKIPAGTAVEVLFKADIVPIVTPTPTPTPAGGLQCTNIDIPGGTSRSVNDQVRFNCSGNPSSGVTQCRFRFGDGSSEEFKDDCTTTHAYGTSGSYDVSCEVRDTNGNWHGASACDGHIEVVTGPTSTPTPTSGPKPTQAQVLSASVPTAQPETGFNTVWLAVLAGIGVAIKLLLMI